MSWAYRIARVSGIDIKIHITFLLILLLGGMEWGRHHGAAGFVFGVLLMLALFTCVTLHELGHSLAAQYFKIPVREIVLLPIGGVALLGKLPEKPSPGADHRRRRTGRERGDRGGPGAGGGAPPSPPSTAAGCSRARRRRRRPRPSCSGCSPPTSPWSSST